VSAARTAHERRKVVTVVFADVVGSTALGEGVDPETLRWAMQRWFERMVDAIERHGGTVENLIGDAVMGVFGIPVVHEDDALRAVRAAAEMREEVAVLRGELRRERGVELGVRIGVNTGEAVTGASATGGFFTAGDIVNVAARLEQAARPGDILLGRDTFRLVRHAVETEPVAPLTVKGKRATVEAHRLLAVATDARGRPERPRAPMVGRQRERRRLLDTFHQAVADRSCHLSTVLGAAGVGKSRLVTEVLETIDGAATVAVGRCLPYGDGLTWWPLVEALGGTGLLERAGPDAGDAAARVFELLEPSGAVVAHEDACWAVRKVIEALGRERPIVLVVDDLQWAEPTFVDVIEHVAEWARDSPVLLLIMARPELLDARPGWGGGKPNATSVLLEPLGEAETGDLLRHLLGAARLGESAVARILDVAEGNPLYVEEIVAMLADQGLLDVPDGDVPIAMPPTIHALLAARLDGLGDGERAVIEAAAIEGKEFAREQVEALVGDSMRDAVGGHLLSLVRTDLIRPAGAREGAFRFRHQLIRDAAYDGIAKKTRAVLHERFADWLEEHRPDLPSVDELLGHHLERAVVLRRELGAGQATTADLAARASASLLRAGRRAGAREEPAATRLLERAAALASDTERPTVLVDLAGALEDEGELLRAAATAREAVRLARVAGDRRTVARARLAELSVTMGHTETDTDIAAFEAAVKPLISELEELDDDEGLAAGLRLMGYITMERYEDATAYLERAIVHAERAGNRLDAVRAAGSLGFLALFGPVPAAEAIERCRALREGVAGHRGTTASLLRFEAMLVAMRGDINEGRALHESADDIMEDLGRPSMAAAGACFTRTLLELLAGAPARAERAARAGLEAFEAMGNRNQGSTAAAMLGLTLVEQGRDDEALQFADLAAAWAVADDTVSQVGQLAVRARVLAGRGEHAAAEAAATEAVALSKRSDELSLRGDALVDLAIVLERAGRAEQAADALRDAIALYERKGNAVSAARARATIDRLGHHAGVTDA
jgi:class 3 adenylate cyclase/tetratricopeptide (TPR) repeat protein